MDSKTGSIQKMTCRGLPMLRQRPALQGLSHDCLTCPEFDSCLHHGITQEPIQGGPFMSLD